MPWCVVLEGFFAAIGGAETVVVEVAIACIYVPGVTPATGSADLPC
jgi:hypothetical protein